MKRDCVGIHEIYINYTVAYFYKFFTNKLFSYFYLIHGQDSMLHPWPIYFHLIRIRSTGNSNSKWRTLNVLSAIFNWQLMASRFLRVKFSSSCDKYFGRILFNARQAIILPMILSTLHPVYFFLEVNFMKKCKVVGSKKFVLVQIHRGAATRWMMFWDALLKHSGSACSLVGIIGTKQNRKTKHLPRVAAPLCRPAMLRANLTYFQNHFGKLIANFPRSK